MDSQYKQQFETISDTSRIISMLSNAQMHGTSIKITLPRSKNIYETVIKHIHSGDQYFHLKRLPDYMAHTKLLEQKMLNVYFQVHGADVSFTAKFMRIYRSNDIETYAIEVPNSIKYRQRRSAFRVHVSLAMNVTTAMIDKKGETYTGQLRDISTEGMKVQFTRTDIKEFSPSNVLPECKIILPDQNDVHCSFKVRHLQENNRKNGFTVGGYFSDLENQDRRAIEKFIADLERKTLREHRV